jgi:Fic family protein
MKITLFGLEDKKKKLDLYRPLPPDLVKNLEDWFRIELTYTSNAIEGNTLSRAETALVVEKGITVEGKPLKDHLEAVNHAQALEWIKQLLAGGPRTDLTEAHILEIHRLVLQKIDDHNAGKYRSIPVRIAGSVSVLPNPLKVPELMAKFIRWLHAAAGNPVKIAAAAHFKLVNIHPFSDGNGRTARLVMNLLLTQSGYPPAIIRREDRKKYIDSVEAGQMTGSLTDFYNLIYQAVNRSLDIYLDAVAPKPEAPKSSAGKLLKIGQLAKLAGETVPTIRHWTKEGLLSVAGHSPGGYRLYSQDMVAAAAKIRRLQTKKRLTLTEIKNRWKH